MVDSVRPFSMLEITSDSHDFFWAFLWTSFHLNYQVYFEGLMEKADCLVSFTHTFSQQNFGRNNNTSHLLRVADTYFGNCLI